MAKTETTIKVASKTADGSWTAYERRQYADGTSDERAIPASEVTVPFQKALASVRDKESRDVSDGNSES